MALNAQDPNPAQQVEDELESDHTSDDERELIERWAPVVDAIKEATMEAFPNSPPKDSAQDFRHYWRSVFTRLSASVAADPKIPKYLTEPSTKKFTANFFDAPHTMCCPCSFPAVDPHIVLENETGVTKEDFMKAFVDAMYGDALPKIYDEDGNMTADGICALAYSSDWMSSGDGPNGERIAYASNFAEEDQVPNIFIYCCEPESFPEKSKPEEAEEEKGEGRESKL